MSIGRIGVTGCPAAGHETGRTRQNGSAADFSGQLAGFTNTQRTGITLFLSNPEEGEVVGSMGDHDSSVLVYKAKDFDAAHPVYQVKVWDASGKMTERSVDISRIDPANADEIEMFAYSSHLSNTGMCPQAQRSFMGAKSYHNSTNRNSLSEKVNWMDIVRGIMQMQYQAGNVKGYLDYKQLLDFMDKPYC